MIFSDMSGARWRKSSFSGAGNDCVELAVEHVGAAIRDSKNPEAGHIALVTTSWKAFLGAVKEDGLD